MVSFWKETESLWDRTIGAGAISAERALSYGFTGPNLRATGVDYDIRVAELILHMKISTLSFQWELPGDTYDRFMVRQQEIWESIKIIEQAYNNLPEGPFHADVPDFYLPEKADVYTKMEALIYTLQNCNGRNRCSERRKFTHAVEGG